MCDEHTEDSNDKLFTAGDLSRRTFGVMSAAALAACASTPENPMTVAEREVEITTPAGVCDAHFAAPSSGKHPAVLVWPDIGGLRPAFRTMGKTLAQSGYAVLTINPFYRTQKGLVYDASKETLQAAIPRLRPMMASLTADTNKVDAIAFTQWLDKQKEVDTKKGIGTTGYCMGGPLVMRSCAYVPDRIKSGATFHGGGIGTNQPNSPHLLVPQFKAKAMLICVAQNDDTTDPESKNRLKAAFEAAKIPADVAVYPAQHGWCAIDSTVFDKAQADIAWTKLLATFKTALA
jgi:carboxymethylenebutenolidase